MRMSTTPGPAATAEPESGGVLPTRGDDPRYTMSDLEVQIVRERTLQRLVEEPAPSLRLGRFILLDRIGSGGMGSVYSAYDEKLDRKVALKFLRGGRHDRRLLIEAQLTARLNHPNVVAVHDVGEHEGRIFVAMEFVAGQTLRATVAALNSSDDGPPQPQFASNLESGVPRWRRVLNLYVQAGRGLAAAHHRRIIHGDFKPDNVLVGEDGRVRVLDFGLARAMAATVVTPDPTPLAGSASGPEAVSPLRSVSKLSGTPGYMAPEQFARGEVSASSDQYSFCVSLWEALYGRRPFAGLELEIMIATARGGRLPGPPASAAVPAWIHAILVRGLATEPEDRWPDIDTLLTALNADPAALRRRWTITLGGAACFLGIGLAIGTANREEGLRCPAPEETLNAIWAPEHRQSVREGFVASRRSGAQSVWQRVAPTLDTHARAYAVKLREVCQQTHEEGTQSTAALDLRISCLRRVRDEFLAVRHELESGQAIGRAIELVDRLTPLSACDDLDALQRPVPLPPDPQLRGEIRAAYRELDEFKVLRAAESFSPAIAARARVAVERARRLAYAPLLAEALYGLAWFQTRLGDVESANVALRESLRLAEASGSDELVARAWLHRQYLEHSVLGQTESAEELHDRTAAAVARARGDVRMRARLAANRAIVSYRKAASEQAGYDQAVNEGREATELLEVGLGSEHPEVAELYLNVSAFLFEAGRSDEAWDAARRAVEIWTRVYGREHQDVAAALENGANALRALGRASEARGTMLEVLRIREHLLGPDHPLVAQTLSNLALDEGVRGRTLEVLHLLSRAVGILEQRDAGPVLAMVLANRCVAYRDLDLSDLAQADCERAMAIRQKLFGPDHPQTAQSLAVLASLASDRGQFADALRVEERILAVMRRTGLESSSVAIITLLNSGLSMLALGRRDEGIARLRRVVELSTASVGPEHPQTLRAKYHLGESLREGGRVAEAVEILTGVAEAAAAAAVPPQEFGDLQFALARALWASRRPGARQQALTRAREAVLAYGRAELQAGRIAEVETWLQAHLVHVAAR